MSRGILLTPVQLAERWQIPVPQLAMQRYRGQGPKFTKIGAHVRYPLEEVEAYEDRNLRQSTLE
ncbi:DNA-binding protein [Bifidobacterium aerophilum]|uniref:DNA-binding protein n=1 Tax=Bifidobacterium aerophilum TaxID=1798155 RepID=A0A6N9Z7B5_9BIFI|nr:DNA-binding protein [Bifidobacterium aerophilum]NEG90577.1 DNA-binding protein [Bifidobacterium aerophilum]